MKKFRVEFNIQAYAFITADTKAEAIETAKSVMGETIELNGDLVQEPDFYDDESPPITFLPTCVIGKPDLRRMEDIEDIDDL